MYVYKIIILKDFQTPALQLMRFLWLIHLEKLKIINKFKLVKVMFKFMKEIVIKKND